MEKLKNNKICGMYSAVVENALQVLHTQTFNIRIPFSLKIVSNAVTHLIKVSFYSLVFSFKNMYTSKHKRL